MPYKSIKIIKSAVSTEKKVNRMDYLEVDATIENLPRVMEFVDSRLEAHDCNMKVQVQIDVSVEELFVNIANYAYEGKVGQATIGFEYIESDNSAKISFSDEGIKYDPLAKADPDITLSAEEREIGGLGIFMVKKNMDQVLYEYTDGKNITTIIKRI